MEELLAEALRPAGSRCALVTSVNKPARFALGSAPGWPKSPGLILPQGAPWAHLAPGGFASIGQSIFCPRGLCFHLQTAVLYESFGMSPAVVGAHPLGMFCRSWPNCANLNLYTRAAQ